MEFFLKKVEVLQKLSSEGEKTPAQVFPENFVKFLSTLIF